MNDIREAVNDAAVGVCLADTSEGLSAIHYPGCAAAIWRRQPEKTFQSWIDGLDAEQLPKARVILRPADVRETVSEICAAHGTPDCAERDWLIDDVAALAEIFAEVTNATHLRLRCDVVSTNACRLFHIDAVTARLICTYRGTGTQYGTSQDGERVSRVFTVATGAPIVLRGTKWPQGRRSGLLHRSPPIEGTGETRLLLVLDPIDDPEEEF